MSHTPSGSNNQPGPSGPQQITYSGTYASTESQNAAIAANPTSGPPDYNPNNPDNSGLLGGGPHSGVFPIQLQHPLAMPQAAINPMPTQQPPNPQPFPFSPHQHQFGFQPPIPSFQGTIPHQSPPSGQPLRLTLGNIIAHSEGCAICMGYIAHMAMASMTDEFGNIIAQRDNQIRGTGSSSSSTSVSCNHEPLITSLQEQLNSLRSIRDIERQTMGDRILALELERDDYRERYHQERDRVDDLTRENEELNESRRYWKYRYGTPDREPEPNITGPSSSGHGKVAPASQDKREESSRSSKKPDRKGKGREVPMVPLEQRITRPVGVDNPDVTVPLSQRLSPMREDTELPAAPVSTTASSEAGSVVIKLPQTNLPTEFSPHAPGRVEAGSGRTAKPYEGPFSSTPSGLTRITLPESSDESDDFEPDPHPNRLKGEARLRQNRINKEAKKRMYDDAVRRNKALGIPPPQKHGKRSKKREFDALRRTVSKEEFKPPSTAEEVDTINHALRESDSFQPPRLMWRTMQGMRRMYEHARAIPAVNRSELEKALVSRFNYIPRWYNDALAEQKKKPFVFPTMQPPRVAMDQTQVVPTTSNDPMESSYTSGGNTGMGSAAPKSWSSLQTRLMEVKYQRSWEGLHEDHSIAEWAERIIHSTNSDHRPGMRVETVDYKFAANTRGIRGMLEVQRLLPNVLGLNEAATTEANIYIHLVLCELVFLPGAYEHILAAPGLSPHATHRPGPLPMYAGPVGVEQIAFDLALRGYTSSHLSDMALYLMWWMEDIAHQIPEMGMAIQQQFVHVVRDVFIQHAHRGVPRSTPRYSEQYMFSDGTTRDNIESAGRFGELQLIVEAIRLKVDRLAPQEADTVASDTAGGVPPAPGNGDTVPQEEPDIIADVPETVDWDKVTHDADGDPVLDYGDGDDTGMDMAR
ncbi:hypothetical protein EV361DRAFT_956335 [Lentinula raphanica]|nr:hypothetical protein EV361DRAFT_956335 [Lentinula raphanica]